MSYQYNIEVVNAIPADTLSSTKGDGPTHKLRLTCVRRDAVFYCTEAPMSFEVRSAPDYDFLECALVTQAGDAAETVVARSQTSLGIGGPHRIVGAVWVSLEAVDSTSSDAAEAESTSSPAAARVFVAWTMTNVDGSPVCASELEVPPSSSVSPRRSTDKGNSAPLSLLLPSRRNSAAAGATNATASLSGDAQHGSNAGGAAAETTGHLTAHVSIVLDEAQEAAQQRDAARGGVRRVAEEPATVPDSSHGSRETVKAMTDPQEVQEAILARFPKCSVSSSFSVTLEESSAAGAAETGSTCDAATSAAALAASTPSNIDLFATSTQHIGAVSCERRHRNLHLVPCPLLLDHLQSEMQASASATSERRGGASAQLWKVAHRNTAATSHLGTATSALEALRLERQARASNTETAALDSATSPLSTTGLDGMRHGVRGESTLTVLRLRAMAAIGQRRVTYTT